MTLGLLGSIRFPRVWITPGRNGDAVGLTAVPAPCLPVQVLQIFRGHYLGRLIVPTSAKNENWIRTRRAGSGHPSGFRRLALFLYGVTPT
jgi:hypothetical protein